MSERYGQAQAVSNREAFVLGTFGTPREQLVVSPLQATNDRVIGTIVDQFTAELDGFGRAMVDYVIHPIQSTAIAVHLTADCPIVVVTDQSAHFAVSIHAGRPGLEKDVVEAACADLLRYTDGLAAAWIGPGIGRDNYELPTDIVGRLYASRSLPPPLSDTAGRAQADLNRLISCDLQRVGIDVNHIVMASADTFDRPEFFSRRRDAAPGFDPMPGCHAVFIGS